MAKKIVEYEIDDNGNCEDCKAEYAGICCAFHSVVRKAYIGKNESNKQQCALCKDFLVTEASKVYCSDCVHLGDYPDWGCDKNQDMENSLNCKNKEAVK
jgi:hypothetical protein